MGCSVALLCLVGLIRQHWLLDKTPKGQRLVSRLGRRKALWLLRGMLIAGAVFGVLLAVGTLNPIRWD